MATPATVLLSVSVLLLGLLKSCQSINLDGSRTAYAKFTSWTPCSNGSVTLDFKTTHANALIFYTHFKETKDYYELTLVNGIIQLDFNIQENRDRLSAGTNLNNNKWHTVKIMRDGRLTILTVDQLTLTREYKGYDPERETFSSSDENYVYIGGLPSSFNDKLSELPLTEAMFEQRLRGSFRNLFYSNCGQALVPGEMMDSVGILLDDDECMQSNPCNHGGICVMRDSGVQCDCSWTDYIGEFCEQEKKPMEASFYGTQYLMYDLSKRGTPIFSNNDRLSLYFKTTQMDGLLFYTGESKDFMTVTLKNGAINVAINLGSGNFHKVVDMKGYKLDDGQWHHVEVTRNARKIMIAIDEIERATGTTMGEFNNLSSNLLYVAGSPNPAEIPGSPVRVNFRGCLKKVEYDADNVKLDLTELAYEDHDLISVIGDVVFQKCEEIVDPEPVTFTTPESFIALPHWDLSSNVGTISFHFSTTELNGLLMYNSGSYETDHLDFFALEIIDGYLYLVLDLGARAIKEKASRSKINDGISHSVFVQYKGQKGYIIVDSHETPYIVSGSQTRLNLVELLYIGGMDFARYNPYRLPKELWSGTLQHGFVGCLQDLMINNIKKDLMTIAQRQRQRDITGECRMSGPQCQSYPCMHNGTCMEGWNRFACDCRSTGYIGNMCELVAATLSFDGAQYMLITLPQESVTEVEDMSMRFRTIHDSGILLLSSSTISDNSIELYLERGACKLTISMGTGSKTLTIGHALNDDRWHTVYVKRRGQNLEMRLDSGRPVYDIIPQVSTTLTISQIALGSVVPMLSDVAAASNSHFEIDDPGNDIQNDDSIPYHPGFVGTLQQFTFNGNHYFQIAQEEHVENIEVTARFDSGESITKDPVTFETRNSYVTLPELRANKHFALYFKFKTTESTGLILFSGRSGHDFLAVELYQGYLYYIYDMGGGTQRIRVNTPEPLNDDKWHAVSLLRPQTDQQQIRVDSNAPTVEDMKGYSARRFDRLGPLYFGGVVKTRYNSLPGQVYSRYGFHGCVASVEIDGSRINLLHGAMSIDGSVIEGCSFTEMTCSSSSCLNGGKCVPSRNQYKCDCDLTSFTGPTCQEESISYELGKIGRGLIVFEHPEDSRTSTNSDYLAFGFKTEQQYAALVRVDSADNDDFIEVELSGGNIFVVYNMGQSDIPIGETFKKVNDGKYHVLKFVRSGANASLQVDNWDRYTKTPKETLLHFYPDHQLTGKQMSIFNQQARVWIGGRQRGSQQGRPGDKSHSKDLTINNAYNGSVSGLVFNGLRILDLLRKGDPRVEAIGDVSSVETMESVSLITKTKPGVDVQSTEGLEQRTTPNDKLDDNIITSSGQGPCLEDDEDQCVTTTEMTGNEIIVPTIKIIRQSTPSPPLKPVTPNVTDCKTENCNAKLTNVNLSSFRPDPDDHSPDIPHTTEVPKGSRATKDANQLNIFLIIAIVAGVVLALVILFIAFYKFRSREEGSYRVDESQNFAYLEAKKQQTNGSAINSVGNGKAGSKKKDVKEWYV